MKTRTIALGVAAASTGLLMAGCGTDFEEHYQATDAPVIMHCNGTIKLPMYAPERFRMQPEKYQNTDWYRQAFAREVPYDVLDYVVLPEYQTESPEHIQDRPIRGNVMPYEHYALGFHYVDSGGKMQPMDLYFDRYSTAEEINHGGGALQFRYRFWAVAPASATHVALRTFDNPANWQHAIAADQRMGEIEEAWYGRQADGYLRSEWQGEPKGVSPTDRTPVTSLQASGANCSASPYFESQLRLGIGFKEDGSNWQMRDERRDTLGESHSRWLSGRSPMRPSQTLPDYIKGTGTKSADNYHFMPLTALSEDGFLGVVEDGGLEGDWFGEKWRQPVDVYDDSWPEKIPMADSQ